MPEKPNAGVDVTLSPDELFQRTTAYLITWLHLLRVRLLAIAQVAPITPKTGIKYYSNKDSEVPAADKLDF
jgi:hypothetical protein